MSLTAARSRSALEIMNALSIGFPSRNLKAALTPRTLIDRAAARARNSRRSLTGSKSKPSILQDAIAGRETRSFLVFGDETSTYTYGPVGEDLKDTAAPVSTGRSDCGWTKNSPPLRQAKKPIHEAVAQAKSSNDSWDNVGQPAK